MRIIIVDVDNRQPADFKIHRESGRADYLFVLYKSAAKVLVNGVYVDVGKGDGIFFDKHKIQSYYPLPPNELLHDFLHFDLENDFEKMIFSDIPLGVPINISFPDIISKTLSDIKDELSASFSRYKEDILTNLGLIFLYRIKDEIDYGDINIKKRANFRNLYNLRTDIYRNPSKDWSIDNICRQVCLSRSYFQHLYKEFFEVSCIEDVISARIKMAKSLLISGNLKVSEIAEKCGYQNTTYFIKQFKNEVGVSPDKFRSD